MWLININALVVLITLVLNFCNGGEWEGPIAQELFDYIYEDYWSTDVSSCIVTDSTISHPDSQFPGVPSIRRCDAKYQINNLTLILPRNTMPICAYYPAWYGTTVKAFRSFYDTGFGLGNSTYEHYKSECMEEILASTKTHIVEMYGVDIHDTACIRYSGFLTITYGLDPEITDIVNKVEAIIAPKSKWPNTLIQARIFVSTICVGINKRGCIGLFNHLLTEKDNSVLNLIGYNVSEIPSTWLYADGIDIEIFHNLVEIMGMNLEVNYVDDIFYYHITPYLPSNHLIKYKPGLIG